jgi:uncharacterized protein YbaR (Trm112 family)
MPKPITTDLTSKATKSSSGGSERDLTPNNSEPLQPASDDPSWSDAVHDMFECFKRRDAEHAGEVYCDVCGHWYDQEDPCKLH